MSDTVLLESGWSERVSNDPKHRPQVLDRPSISDPRTIKRLNGNLFFERNNFLGIVTSEVIRQCKFLSYDVHYQAVYELITRFLMPDLVREIVRPLLPSLSDKDISVMLDDCDFQARCDLYGDEQIDKPGWIKWRVELVDEINNRREDKKGSEIL